MHPPPPWTTMQIYHALLDLVQDVLLLHGQPVTLQQIGQGVHRHLTESLIYIHTLKLRLQTERLRVVLFVSPIKGNKASSSSAHAGIMFQSVVLA